MKLVVSWIAVLLVAATPALAHAQAGLDRGFGKGGTVLTPAAKGVPLAAATDPEGRIVLAGSSRYKGGVLFRYLRGGAPDPSFGSGGMAVHGAAPAEAIGAVAADSSGRLLASIGFRQHITVARYLGDGSLDRAFANGGFVTVPIPPEVGDMPEGPSYKENSISVDGSGRITVGRVKTNRVSSRSGTGVVLARFTEGGTLDASFGDAGFFTAELAHATPFQLTYAGTDATGQKAIVVATTFTRPDGAQGPELKHFEVSRLLLDGTLDPSFGGGDGIARALAGPRGTTASVVGIDSRQRIVVGGANGRRFGFARFRADGTPDGSFGSRGRIAIRATPRLAGADLRAIAIDDSDRIVVAGRAAVEGINNDDFMAFRLRGDGRLDRRFGRSGTCTASFPNREAYPTAVSLAGGGDAVISGAAELPRPDIYPPTAERTPAFALAKCAGRP